MTHAYLGLAGLNLVFVAVGAAALFGFGFVRLQPAAAIYAGPALLLGWAALAIASSLAASVGVDAGIPETAAEAGVCAIVLLLLRRAFCGPADTARLPPAAPLLRVAAIAGAIVVASAAASAFAVAVKSGADSSWDVWNFWLPKAKAIYYFHGLETGLGGFTTYSSPSYPPAAPLMAATAFHFMGGVHPTLLPLQQCVLGISFLAAVPVLVGRRAQPAILFPVLGLLAVAPQFWQRMAIVLPDQTVGYLVALAVLACLIWLQERRGAWLALAVVLLGAAVLTKAEGFFFGGALAVALSAVATRRRTGWPALALFAAPALLLPWKLWLWRHGQPLSPSEYHFTDLLRPQYLVSHAWRLRYGSERLVSVIFDFHSWRLVLPLGLLALALAARVDRKAAALVGLWLLLAFAALAAVYWIGRPEVHFYVASSAQRVAGTLPIVVGAVAPLLLTQALARTAPDVRFRTAGSHAATLAPVEPR